MATAKPIDRLPELVDYNWDCKDDINTRDGLDLTVGLVAHWKMNDDAANTTVRDAAGGNDGTAQQNTEDMSVIGKHGRALDFNGSSDYVSTGISSVEGYSESFWFKTSASAAGVIIAGLRQNTGSTFIDANGKINIRKSDTSMVKTNSAFNDGRWHHCVITDDLIYVDNSLQDTVAGTTLTSTELVIGARNQGGYAIFFDGIIDDIRIYNRVLSFREIKALYYRGGTEEAETLSDHTSLVGHWRMNDDAASTTVEDSSGNGNDGTSANNTDGMSVNGKIGKALEFDGATDEVGLGAGTFDLTGDWTFSTWVSTDSVAAASAFIFFEVSVGPTRRLYIYRTGDDLTLMIGTGGAVNTGVDIFEVGEWIHIAAIYDASRGIVTTYVNGRDTGIPYTVEGLDATTGNFFIGSSNGANFFDGVIDDTKLYTAALTAGEIWDIYLAGLGTEDDIRELDSLVGHWKCNDDAANTHVEDSSGHENHGTSARNTSLMNAAGKINDCFDLDGANDYVDCGIDESLRPRMLSLSLWMYADPATPAYSNVAGCYHYTAPEQWGFGLYMGGAGATLSGSIGLVGNDRLDLPSAIAYSSWYHVVMTYDERVARLYINGALAYTDEGNRRINYDESDPLILGAGYGYGQKFVGKIDDVRMYRRVLSPEEIKAIYNHDDGTEDVDIKYNRLVAHYKMNDNAATSTVEDATGNHDGTYLDAGGAINTNTGSVAGKINTALDFDGGDEWVWLPAISVLPRNFSIVCWFNADDITQNQRLYARGSGGNDISIRLTGSQAYGIVGADGGGTVSGSVSSTLSSATWYHAVLTFDGLLLRLYIDGVKEAEDAANTYVDADAISAAMSSIAGSSEFFEGPLDDVRIYDRALTEKEIKALYNHDAGTEDEEGSYSSLVGAWLNKAMVNRFNDYSLQGNDGVVIGAPLPQRVGYDFDGTADAVNIDAEVSILSKSTVGTWSGWFAFDDVTPATNSRYIICFGDTDAAEMLAIYINTDGTLGAIAFDAGALDWQMASDAAVFLADLKWYFVCIVQDGVESKLYVDGEEIASTFSTANDKTSWFSQCAGIDNGRIMCRNFNGGGDDRFVEGKAKDVRVLDDAKSADWIKYQYKLGVPE